MLLFEITIFFDILNYKTLTITCKIFLNTKICIELTKKRMDVIILL